MSGKNDPTPRFFSDIRNDYADLFQTTGSKERDAAMNAWDEMEASEQRYHMSRLLYGVNRGLAVLLAQHESTAEYLVKATARQVELVETISEIMAEALDPSDTADQPDDDQPDEDRSDDESDEEEGEKPGDDAPLFIDGEAEPVRQHRRFPRPHDDDDQESTDE